MPIEPDEQQLQDLTARAGGADDGPIVMLNLNRYRDRDVYLRYGMVAMGKVAAAGGQVLWGAQDPLTVVGAGDADYDEVIAVWYPSCAAFLQMVADPEYVAALPDRVAGLERATLICCDAGGHFAP
ncbi:MAG: DUF1330 domain-containing protein [Solirubrobacteraceae bacterium]